VDYHFIHEKLQSKEMKTPFFYSENQLVGIFIEGLESQTFENDMYKLGMINIYTSTLRGSVEI
jgi:hypothetical protein